MRARLVSTVSASMISLNFNPRAPCGARPGPLEKRRQIMLFQSTRPMRGATTERGFTRLTIKISIHAPRAGATFTGQSIATDGSISIHAPHAGRDRSSFWDNALAWHFNPRAPCGARRWFPEYHSRKTRYFNPRAPCGARPGRSQNAVDLRSGISIHAPRAGRDAAMELSSAAKKYFNPRAPCGARRRTSAGSVSAGIFQSTRPVRGATPRTRCRPRRPAYFNPRAPCGARQETSDEDAQG